LLNKTNYDGLYNAISCEQLFSATTVTNHMTNFPRLTGVGEIDSFLVVL